MTEQRRVTPADASAKKWWERPLGIVALGVVVAVVGGLIVWLISRHYDKPTLSTAIEQPRTQPIPPSVPIAKTPLARPSVSTASPTKPQQDNSVHIGDRTTVSQSSTGDCSPNMIGGTNTVNCGPPAPPPLHYTWSTKDVKSQKPEYKFAKAIVVQTNIVTQPVSIAVRADGEIEDLTVCCGVFMMESIGNDTNDKRKWFVSFEAPAFRPDKSLLVTVFSEKPLSILAVMPIQGP